VLPPSRDVDVGLIECKRLKTCNLDLLDDAKNVSPEAITDLTNAEVLFIFEIQSTALRKSKALSESQL
jgi:hypothetical protein